MIIVLYHGQELDLPSAEGIENITRCYNPFCTKLVQKRPSDRTLPGPPKWYCTERCRNSWKQKRRRERKYLERIERLEKMH